MTAKLKNETYLARVTEDFGQLRKGERVGVYRYEGRWVVLTDRAGGNNIAVEMTEEQAKGHLQTRRDSAGKPYRADSSHFGIARIQYEDRKIRYGYNS